MNDVFISYASEDRERARTFAAALEQHGWSVWWDREIPFGRSYDEVIEEALNGARCMLVLWTTASAASEWVRSEASEGKRRGILVPVFLDEVEAPLAFRLLNGAQLWNWKPGEPNPEFDRLTRRIGEILAQAPASKPVPPSPPPPAFDREPAQPSAGTVTVSDGNRLKSPWVVGGAGVFAALLLVAGYQWFARDHSPAAPTSAAQPATNAPTTALPTNGSPLPGNEFSNLEAALKPLALGLGSPANLALRAFKIPALGLDIAYVDAAQSATTGGSLPTGAVVTIVSDGPAQQAGMQVFDVVTAIDGKSLRDDNDLRRLVAEMGPGRHTLGILRAGAARKLTLNCPGCESAHKVAVTVPSKPQATARSSEAAAPATAPKPSVSPTPPSRVAVSATAPETAAEPVKPVPPPVKVATAAPRPAIAVAALGLPIRRSFWSGESSATYTHKMETVLQRTSRDVLRMNPKAIDLSQSEFDAWWNESREHAKSRARCAEADAPKALLSARVQTPPAFSTVESAYWPELQLRLWLCDRQMGFRQAKVLSPRNDDEWPFSVELSAETERFLREHRADLAD